MRACKQSYFPEEKHPRAGNRNFCLVRLWRLLSENILALAWDSPQSLHNHQKEESVIGIVN